MQRRSLSTLYAGLLLLASPLLRADVIGVGSINVSLGASFDLPVIITGTSDLYAFQFDVSYDPGVLQLNSILEGSFLSSTGPTFFIPGMIDNSVGTATFTADTLFGATAAAGAGTLATLSFKALAGGVSALNLSNVILLDSTLNNITFTAQSGEVSVSNVPEPNSIWLLAFGLFLSRLLRNRRFPGSATPAMRIVPCLSSDRCRART